MTPEGSPSAAIADDRMICLVFAMGMEAFPFLRRVEVKRRWTSGKATYREAYFEGKTLMAVKCGVGPVRAAAAMERLKEPPAVIVSVGTAGALAPGLRVGDIIAASATLADNGAPEALQCSESLVESLSVACAREGRAFRTGSLITVSKAVFEAKDRLALHHRTGALAVDMESHALGLQARRVGAAFACLRVISDEAASGAFPEKPNPRRLLKSPLSGPGMLADFLQRRRFLQGMKAAIDTLPPILVRFIRLLEKARSQYAATDARK